MTDVSDLCVRVTYRDKDKQPVYAKTYTLREYTEMLRQDLLRVITDIEDLCYTANENKPKEDWTDETFTGFNKIKHKILDKAGDIGRLPDTLRSRPESLTEVMARILNEGEMPYGESRLGSEGRHTCGS